MRNLLAFIKKRPLVTMLLVAVFGAALVGAVVPSENNTALAASRDCSANAIVKCGTHTAAEFQQKYNANSPGDLTHIFAHYGVNPSEMSSAKNGYVTKSGNVTVDGKVVATKAYTVGRTTMPQSHTVTINGKTYYERNNTSNFGGDLEALVVLDQFGRFKYAVIKSCGNPVVAVPTQPAPAATCDTLTTVALNRTEYRFTSKASASNGATVTGYAYDFGDGNKQNGGATITHEYAAPGTYKVTVTAKTNIGDKTGAACQVTVTISPEKVIKNIEVCDLASKQVVTIDESTFDSTKHSKDLNDCKEVPPVPETPPVPELPQTGAGEAILGVIGLGALVASSAYFVLGRIRL